MSSPVDKIKERLSIFDVVSSYIQVVKSGKNYKAKCPFHNEKTPSFFISTDREAYYCFGCGAKGDIFSFVEQFEGLDFMGAMKLLAERAGVPLIYDRNDKTKDEKEKYYKIVEEATKFFENNLVLNKNAEDYLKKRGLTEQTIKLFRIGYAKEEWRSMMEHLTSKGYKKEDLEIVGLIKKSESNYYDRFRGRIIFPISDSSGRVIAFTGRIFPEKEGEAKYLNSPETPLFNKSSVLFGIDKAKSAIRLRDYTIVVEGQIDLILSHQAGFTNTVAVSGTAFAEKTEGKEKLTEDNNEQKVNNLGLIKRLSQNIIFAFDGDKAGIKAASRGAMIALSLDMQVKIAVLPEDKDPADVIFEDKEKWKEIIKNSVNIISFHINKICEESNDARIRGQKIREIIFPFLAVIKSSIERSAYISEIHQKTSIPIPAIIEDFENYEKNVNQGIHSVDKLPEKQDQKIRIEELAKKFMGIIFWFESLKNEDIEMLTVRDSFKKEIGKDEFNKIYENYKMTASDLAFEAEMWYGGEIKQAIRDAKELALNLEEEILGGELIRLEKEINNNKKTDQNKELSIVLDRYQKIVGRIEDIKNLRRQ